MNLRKTILPLLLLAGMPSVVAHAQLNTTAAVGTVTDATGAAIPDATVTLTQTETNVARTVTTQADGAFRAEFLPVGPYKLKVTAAGYKATERSGIILQVLNTATLERYSLCRRGLRSCQRYQRRSAHQREQCDAWPCRRESRG